MRTIAITMSCCAADTAHFFARILKRRNFPRNSRKECPETMEVFGYEFRSRPSARTNTDMERRDFHKHIQYLGKAQSPRFALKFVFADVLSNEEPSEYASCCGNLAPFSPGGCVKRQQIRSPPCPKQTLPGLGHWVAHRHWPTARCSSVLSVARSLLKASKLSAGSNLPSNSSTTTRSEGEQQAFIRQAVSPSAPSQRQR